MHNYRRCLPLSLPPSLSLSIYRSLLALGSVVNIDHEGCRQTYVFPPNKTQPPLCQIAFTAGLVQSSHEAQTWNRTVRASTTKENMGSHCPNCSLFKVSFLQVCKRSYTACLKISSDQTPRSFEVSQLLPKSSPCFWLWFSGLDTPGRSTHYYFPYENRHCSSWTGYLLCIPQTIINF